MEPLLITAAGLIVLVAIAHSWLGERYIVIRLLRRSDLPRLFGAQTFTRHTIRFAWHLTSIAWLGIAGTLMAIATADTGDRAAPGVVLTIAATFLVSAIYALVATRCRHLSWIVFLAVAILCGVVVL